MAEERLPATWWCEQMPMIDQCERPLSFFCFHFSELMLSISVHTQYLCPSRGERPQQGIIQCSTQWLGLHWPKVEKFFELPVKADLMKMSKPLKSQVTYFLVKGVNVKHFKLYAYIKYLFFHSPRDPLIIFVYKVFKVS